MKRKRLLVFLCAAALLQGVVILCCTEGGLMAAYPMLFRIRDEEIDINGPNTVYYDMRLAASEAPLVVVGVDFSVKESYEAFLHLFRFLKQYRNITEIRLQEEFPYLSGIQERMADALFENGLPEVLKDFSDGLAKINETMSPARKFSLESLSSDGEENLYTGEILLLLDRDRMMAERERWEDAGALCLEMKYVNCTVGSGEIRQDMDLPFSGDEVRISFLSASRLQWFYTYFDKVTDLFGQKKGDTANTLEAFSAKYVICIANGNASGVEP